MTDRHAGYLVALDRDIREDDAEYIINALKMIKGVLSVTPVMPEPGDGIVQMRRDREWEMALLKLIREGAPSS
jgi:hypothetical protein